MDPPEDREESFRRIYALYYQHVTAYVRRRLDAPDADDAVAETFLIAWRRLGDIPDGDVVLPWLYGVARKVVSQSKRSGRRRERLVSRMHRLQETEDEASPPESERLDDRQIVQAALARLRPEDQEILRLAEWEELRPPELAVAFGCSVNAASIRLHRARKRFEQVLNSIGGGREPDPVPVEEAAG